MTSKGFSSRAARDLLDLLADTDEPLSVFCVHDADASGTMIYQTLQEATKARQRRRVEIINLGLEPWEALGMDLQVEDVKGRDRRAPVADYVGQEGPSDEDWPEWLQGRRVELNAMTTPQFIAWLDEKMEEHGGEKVVPPVEVVFEDVRERLANELRTSITERILREAKLEEQVAAAVAAISLPDSQSLLFQVAEGLVEDPEQHWTDCAQILAVELATTGAAP